jgi:cell division protein ZapE
MREVHRELRDLQGTVNPLDELGRTHGQALQADLLRRVPRRGHHRRDDPAPAAGALFDNGVGFVTTSNFKPDDLYPDGLHRDRILPAIALLNEKLEVLSVDNGTDYRRRTLEQLRMYLTPNGPRPMPEMRKAFDKNWPSRRRGPGAAHRGARDPRAAQGRRRGLVRLPTLCGGPRSQNDYLEIASQFHTVLLSDVPHMPVRMASEARRFTWLVDVLYDRRVKLIMSAEVPPEALYTEGPLAHEFPRTVSRLTEMQSSEFLSLERRIVDTRLT